MTKNSLFSAGLIAGAALGAVLTGCVTAGSGPGSRSPARPVVAAQATLMIEDDYDYYPRYEIYYSRRRNEYVYRDSNAWVRRSDLHGITLAMLDSGPMVRMDFHDSPELHHGRIVQNFPRNWEQPGKTRDDRNAKDEKHDQRDDNQKSDQHRN